MGKVRFWGFCVFLDFKNILSEACHHTPEIRKLSLLWRCRCCIGRMKKLGYCLHKIFECCS
ncbi:unnamed protein product [Moneuplotes crassus]|uniref:Uncharacterized protein n=1 Tax=Euplotes crassus TaxID=5936 RepID=A0AAD1XMX1_EUPCR|nr:unnamed protein product [Moneuplotes crassus]